MLTQISTALSEEEYILKEGETRGTKLEELLTTICNALGEVGSLTENKADIGFLLSILGTYLISKKQGTLADDIVHPTQLFDENLFPMLDETELTVEEIPTDEEATG